MKHKIISFILKLVGIALCVLYWSTTYFWLLITVFIIVSLAIIIVGSYKIQLNYHIKSINKGKANGVVLTFDDGPDPKITPQVLAVLKKYNLKATFFLIGSKVEKHPEVVKSIVEEGHIVANHSYSHSNFIPFFFSKKLKKDFDKCSELIKSAVGKKPLLIRPPFGATSPRYFKMMRKTKFTSIGWTVRSYDTVEKKPEKLTETVVEKVEKETSPIVLMHDTQEVTVKALPEIIERLKAKGIEIVPLEQSVQINPYE